MADVELISYRIAKLQMNNNIPKTGRVELENIVGFDVIHGQDDSMAILNAQIKHRQNPNVFGIELELQGLFRTNGICDADTEREAHIRCYDEMFPYVNQIMTYLAINSGMQGFALKKIPIEFAGINFGAKPENGIDGGKVIKLWSDV